MKTERHIRATLFAEITRNTFKLLGENQGLEVPIERAENGRLTPESAQQITSQTHQFLKRSRVGSGSVVCAIGARGVSLRRINLPMARPEDLDALLLLQIEKEFPVSPDELAWGAQRIASPTDPIDDGLAASQEFVVAAIKKEFISDYARVFSGAGLNPEFTLGGLAASAICPKESSSYALLDIGSHQSDLTVFESGSPTAIRVIPWGNASIPEAAQTGVHSDPVQPHPLNPGETGSRSSVRPALSEAATDALARLIQPALTSGTLYLAGQTLEVDPVALSRALGGNIQCSRIDFPPGPGISAATFGLKTFAERNGHAPALLLKSSSVTSSAAQSLGLARWKWPAITACLLLFLLSLRYAEPFLKKDALAKSIAGIRLQKQQLPDIDRELTFLQHLHTNQPACLNALLALAHSAAPGMRIDSLSLTRRGDLSLRATIQNPQQATDFRSKLIDTGIFLSVTMQEQSPGPGPDRQRLTVRMSARWNPSKDARLNITNTPAATASSRPQPIPNLPPPHALAH